MENLFRLAPGRGVSFAMVAVLSLFGFTLLAISSCDHSSAAFPGANAKIAYSHAGSIWSANPDGSSPIRLTTGSEDFAPAYSADGGTIAFERDDGVSVMLPDGSTVKDILKGKGSSASDAEWLSDYETPQGKIIPFVKVAKESSASLAYKDPHFSPDGSLLAVVKKVKNSIFVSTCEVEESGGQECLAYSDPNAYYSYKFDCACTSQIIEVKSADGKLINEITRAETEAFFQGPTYSVKGDLAYSRSSPDTQGSAIFVVRSPGAIPIQVSNGPNDYAPDFSPGGWRIVFAHGTHDIALVDLDGGWLNALSVASPPGTHGGYVESPAFSPDGSRIVFERSVVLPEGEVERGIYTVEANGSNLTKVIDDGSSPSWQSGPWPRALPGIEWARFELKGIRLTLNRENRIVLGWIFCGSSRCKLKPISSKLRIDKTECSVSTVVASRLAPGKSTKVRVKVAGKCLAALKRVREGLLLIKVRVVSALGKQVLWLRSKARMWPRLRVNRN